MATLKMGSTTMLTESSGALTVNVSDPTITLGSNTTFSGDAGQKTAKAWVNANQTGTQAIRDSYGVSSITDNATGRTTVNLSTATTTNACPVSSGLLATGNVTSSSGYLTRATMSTTTAFHIYCLNVNENESTSSDFEFISGILFGD
jgi:hypothetical protein